MELNELITSLIDVLVTDLKKGPDDLFISNGKKSWTKHEYAHELEQRTDMGINILSSVLMLTIDQVSRGKKTLPKTMSTHGANNKKWFVKYVRSNAKEDIFLVIELDAQHNKISYEYRDRDQCTEEDILDSLPE